MNERIALLIKAKDITPAQLADDLGVQRSGISHILNGRNNPSLDFVQRVLRLYPDISTQWLLFGEGPMMNPYPQDHNEPDRSKTPVSMGLKPFTMDLFADESTEESVQPAHKEESNEQSVIKDIDNHQVTLPDQPAELAQKNEQKKSEPGLSPKLSAELPIQELSGKERYADTVKRKEKPPAQDDTERRLIKIVMFYSDKTFTEFIPQAEE